MANIVEVAYKLNGTLQKRTKTNYIVLHHAAATKATVADIDRWHKEKGWTCIGYHFYVDKAGRIFRGRPIDTIGAHCLGHNNDSIGICAEGNFNVEKMNDKQKQAVIELLKDLVKKYPKAKIVRHKDLMSTDCPGNNYPFLEIIREVQGK